MEAIEILQTQVELAGTFLVNSIIISKWKTEFLEDLSVTFDEEDSAEQQGQDTEKLYAAIDQ